MSFHLPSLKGSTCLKYVFILLCLLCVVITLFIEVLDPCNFTITKTFYSISSQISCQLEARNFENKHLYAHVEIVGIHQRTSEESDKKKYILVLPRKTSCSSCTKRLCHGVSHLINVLESWSDFDGASCSADSLQSCRFFSQYWSMVIQTGNRIHTRKVEHHAYSFFNCNIVEAPFLIRRNVFNTLGFRPSHGETTLLDFFLRSKGTLKIASLTNCLFTDEQLVTDRGAMETKQIYLDYGLLGYNHNILRVIRKDSITWSQCTRSEDYCPNKPLQEIGNSISRRLSLICCDVALNQYLIDAVNGLAEAGVDYRLCFGTLLGAVRSRNIIPWTTDIDIDLALEDYRDSSAFYHLQQIMRRKNYATPLIYQLRRIIPLFPLRTQFPGLFKHDLFSKIILEQMRGVLPIWKPEWRSIGYVDIYAYEGARTTPVNVTINGRKYKTHSNVETYLTKTFGSSWRRIQPSYKSKDPHKPWIWRLDASMEQEDSPTPRSYCSVIYTCSMVLLGMFVIPIILCTFIPSLLRGVSMFYGKQSLK